MVFTAIYFIFSLIQNILLYQLLRDPPSPPDTEKVASMQALLADNFCKNCGHFCINNKLLVLFTHQLPQFCITYPQLIYFSAKKSNVLEKIKLDHFYIIRK